MPLFGCGPNVGNGAGFDHPANPAPEKRLPTSRQSSAPELPTWASASGRSSGIGSAAVRICRLGAELLGAVATWGSHETLWGLGELVAEPGQMTGGKGRRSIGAWVSGPVSASRVGPTCGVRAANPASQPPRRSVIFAKVSADPSTAVVERALGARSRRPCRRRPSSVARMQQVGTRRPSVPEPRPARTHRLPCRSARR